MEKGREEKSNRRRERNKGMGRSGKREGLKEGRGGGRERIDRYEKNEEIKRERIWEGKEEKAKKDGLREGKGEKKKNV